MIPKECNRLAGVDFPIAVVSKHSAREKSIRHGRPSTVHLWWARRPLGACPAMLLGPLLPNPCDPHCPAEIKTKARALPARTQGHIDADDMGLRKALPDFIGDFAAWETSSSLVVMEYEAAQGRQMYDVHEKNLGYDVTSLDVNSGELRLIEVKGLGAATGTILLTPNERRVAEDRPDCYWLYVVTNCSTEPSLQEPVKDPARFPWHEVSKVQHYWLDVNAMIRSVDADEGTSAFGTKGDGR